MLNGLLSSTKGTVNSTWCWLAQGGSLS